MLGLILAVFEVGIVSQSPYKEVHYSTIFASIDPVTNKRDKWAGGKSPCLKRLVRQTDNVIAHRTLPCGTKVKITNLRTNKTTISRVGERGPYGACIKKGWKVGTTCPRGHWRLKRKASDPGIWRGAFDLTPRVARRLRHNGFELIEVEVIPKKKRLVRSSHAR